MKVNCVKRIFTLLLAVCLLAAALPMSASAASAIYKVPGQDDAYLKIDSVSGLVVNATAGIKGELVIPSVVQGIKITGVGAKALRYQYEMTSVTLPEGATRVEEMAFADCDSLEEVNLPDTVTYMGESCFFNCMKLKKIDLPEYLHAIPEHAFDWCVNLSSVTISANTESIGPYAFNGCSALKRVVLPDGVRELSNWAFNACSSLTIMGVPRSVESIGPYAFNGCDSIKLYVEGRSYAQVFAAAAGIPYDYSGVIPDENGDTPTVFPFTDVDDNWALDAIKWAFENKYIFGITDTIFGPDVVLNRAMLVTMLYRMEGRPAVESSSSFIDVNDSDYFADPVAWGKQSGVVAGVEPDQFGPYESITREQLAAMLYRYALYKEMDTFERTALGKFKDNGQISSYATTAISWAVGSKIIAGVEEDVLEPQGGATRAQAVAMLQRFARLQQE